MTVSDVPALRDRAENKSKTPENLAVYLDPQRYLSHLDTLDISENQKLELLKTLWLIMGSFVDRAFGDDPVQRVLHGRDVDTLRTTDESVAAGMLGSPKPHDKQHRLTSAFRPNAADMRGKEDSSA